MSDNSPGPADGNDDSGPSPARSRRRWMTIIGAAVVVLGLVIAATVALNRDEKGPSLDVSAEVLCGPMPESSSFEDGVSSARFRWAEGEQIFGVVALTNNEKVPVTVASLAPVDVADDLDLTIRAGSSSGPDACDGTEVGPEVDGVEIAAGESGYVSFTIEMNGCRVKQAEGASIWRRRPALMARVEREGVGSDVPVGPYDEIEYWFLQGCDGP